MFDDEFEDDDDYEGCTCDYCMGYDYDEEDEEYDDDDDYDECQCDICQGFDDEDY